MAGCASTDASAEQAPPLSTEADRGAGGEDAEDGEGGEGGGSDLAPRPYEKQPGGKEAPREVDVGEVRFRAPEHWPKVLTLKQRPRLRLPARLAVAWVERGLVVFEIKPLLKLEARLAKDPQLKQVVALSSPRRREVTLVDLARQAHAEGRNLLLIELRSGRAGLQRQALLLQAPRGELLAHVTWKKNPKGRPQPVPRWASAPDLSGRIARAYEVTRRPPPPKR
jgi:hypothetical protein